MTEPQLVGSNPMHDIVDRAMRKEIPWSEARARLRWLLKDQPELFQGIEQDVLEDLVHDEHPE